MCNENLIVAVISYFKTGFLFFFQFIEMLAAQQRPSVMNLNRDRRQKYHHPKGAPDADLIFGNK